jgi:hypothetical protein
MGGWRECSFLKKRTKKLSAMAQGLSPCPSPKIAGPPKQGDDFLFFGGK